MGAVAEAIEQSAGVDLGRSSGFCGGLLARPSGVKSRCTTGRRTSAEGMRLSLREMRMIALNAGIEHGPNDAIAEGLEGALGGVGLYGGDGLSEGGGDGLILPNAVDHAGGGAVGR